MTAVNISPTFSKDTRPSNGLEEIAEQLINNQLGVHYVVGAVQFSGATLPGPNEELVPRVKFLAIEPLSGDAAGNAQAILDQARKTRGLGKLEDQKLPEPTLFDFDGPGDGEPRQVGEVRMTGDGEREVPEPSGEELLAEHEEGKAAKAPAAKFSGGVE